MNFAYCWERLNLFWRRYPALLTGLAALLLTALYQTGHPVYYLPLAVIIFPYCGIKLSFVFFTLVYIALNTFPRAPTPEMVTEGTFYPASIKEQRTPFGMKWEYRGNITLANHTTLPIQIQLPLKPFLPRPSGDVAYHLKGMIKEGLQGPIFIPLKHSRWMPIQPIFFGVAEWRYHSKKWLKKEIQRRFSSEKAARFLEGISTGDFQDRVMSREFSRFGLQHIMAVSGFHFAVITGILSWIFFGMFGRVRGACFLLFALLGYFIFLGGTPSITRAWISASLLMIGVLLGTKTKSLNSLGLGLLAVLAADPRAIYQMGFQFSFAITASILLFTAPIDRALSYVFSVRRLHTAIYMNTTEQFGYILLHWIKKGMALALAVNICALPMTLAFFGQFPIWSLFFNLFFPLMVSLAIFFLILGLTVGPVFERFGWEPNNLNNWFTDTMLNLAYNFPHQWDIHFEWGNIPSELLVVYLTVIFTAGALLEYKFDTDII